MKTVSVIIPVLNEEAILPELYRRLSEALRGQPYRFEWIFVDDGSTDGSLAVMCGLHGKDPRVHIVGLARNFGHQEALMAGIDAARGDAVILMDADLQDLPEALPMFLQKWENGCQVVYAVRIKRKEGFFKRLAFAAFYKIQKGLVRMPMPLDAGIFSLMDRCVVDVLRRMPERNRYLAGLRAYAGFRQEGIEVERGARAQGRPRVGMRGLLRLAFDGIFAFTTVPLRLILVAGALCAALALVLAAAGLVCRYGFGVQLLDWPFGLSTTFFFGGVQLVSIGIIGEYVGKIYEEVKQRPSYVTARKIGFERGDD